MTGQKYDYDYVIIGSGFGGSVSALRLSEKEYKVLVIEKGKWYKNPEDFAKTTWNLKKWLWAPSLGLQGILKLTFFRHVGIVSGTAVGGGSIVYANTLPVPKTSFFNSGHWAGLEDWENELKPFYDLARKMLGAEKHPYTSYNDKVMLQLAEEMGKKEDFEKADVAVYFGKPGVTVPDPYFNGKGPDRTGCTLCGGCMVGCRYNSKNTLDKNYLYLAQQLGSEIIAEKEVFDVKALNTDGSDGYEISYKDSLKWFKKKSIVKTKGVIFAGGVLGTVDLLLKLKEKSLPNISDTVGYGIRTNSESLIGVTTFRKDLTLSDGIAIGSIVHIDENRHVEPVRYSAGSGFWRLFMAPMVLAESMAGRFLAMIKDLFIHPLDNLKAFFIDDWAKRTHILLYMESIDSTLRFKRSLFGGMKSSLEKGKAPSAFNPIAQTIARRVATIINGKPMVLSTETLFGIPTTAHILGGSCMGKDVDSGVIDATNHVFNYKNMMVCDGSAISANPGVNPSLSITAITERAMSLIPSNDRINKN
ncbi:MAG: GMC oxidoreductase [Saprospiraceae bacterium]|jgi:cholesterol oxidase